MVMHTRGWVMMVMYTDGLDDDGDAYEKRGDDGDVYERLGDDGDVYGLVG